MTLLRDARERAGFTQAGLAALAGVSRQLIGSVENGHHMPRVDAAIALARALDTDVSALFDENRPHGLVDVTTGEAPPIGSVVNIGKVGDRVVTAPARHSAAGFEAADAVVDSEGLQDLKTHGGVVVAGCEPALLVMEQMLRARGLSALAVSTSSAVAAEALAEGRCHAAVVHGSTSWVTATPPVEAVVIGLGSWRVGLAAPRDADTGWWRSALEGTHPVIQREPGAGVQRSFLGARISSDSPPGPVVASHLDAARASVISGIPAVTIEPAALAAGASFYPLDVHDSALWIDRRWDGSPELSTALDVLAGRRLLQRLRAVGGYDLSDWGTRVA